MGTKIRITTRKIRPINLLKFCTFLGPQFFEVNIEKVLVKFNFHAIQCNRNMV
jgi:hypothetical protein